MSKHKTQSSFQDKINVRNEFKQFKAIEGGDLDRYFDQVKHLDRVTALMWVCCALQRDLYHVRGQLMEIAERENESTAGTSDSGDEQKRQGESETEGAGTSDDVSGNSSRDASSAKG